MHNFTNWADLRCALGNWTSVVDLAQFSTKTAPFTRLFADALSPIYPLPLRARTSNTKRTKIPRIVFLCAHSAHCWRYLNASDKYQRQHAANALGPFKEGGAPFWCNHRRRPSSRNQDPKTFENRTGATNPNPFASPPRSISGAPVAPSARTIPNYSRPVIWPGCHCDAFRWIARILRGPFVDGTPRRLRRGRCGFA